MSSSAGPPTPKGGLTLLPAVAASPDSPRHDRGLSDEQLVSLSIHEPHHFAGLFDRHAAKVHHYLSRRIGDLADDLLSETFLAAFKQRASYRPERTTVLPWLYGIATNLVRNHHRTETRRYRMLAATAGHPVDAPFTTDSDDRVDAQALTADIARALADLAPADRDALLLFAWGQLSYQEIADTQAVPVGTVRSRLHRARQRTQAALSPHHHTSKDPR